jgi:hypothetical protein
MFTVRSCSCTPADFEATHGRVGAIADNLVAYLKALGGSTLVKRLGTEAFDDILFGTSRYPSEMVDLGDLDI